MSRKFKIRKNYYDDYTLYQKSMITLKPGVTVLVGCNGSGKTTLLRHLKDSLTNNKIPVVSFDNLHDGGSNSIRSASFIGDTNFVVSSACSSEGENIVLNVGKFASTLRKFIKTGEKPSDFSDNLSKLFASLSGKKDDDSVITSNERWLLFDAVDSGLSVDNIIDLKEQLFETILEDGKDCDIYIVISANEYEIARNENCFDVYAGKYIKFSDYEDYRQFIINSRKIKDMRYDKEV